MENTENLVQQINALNKAYESRELRISHKEYLKRYNALKRKWKKAVRKSMNIQTISEQMKEWGSRSKKLYQGVYLYEGKNFNAEYQEAACETTWWEVELYGEGVDPKVFEEFEDYNQFDRKIDVLGQLFNLDKKISESCAKK